MAGYLLAAGFVILLLVGLAIAIRNEIEWRRKHPVNWSAFGRTLMLLVTSPVWVPLAVLGFAVFSIVVTAPIWIPVTLFVRWFL